MFYSLLTINRCIGQWLYIPQAIYRPIVGCLRYICFNPEHVAGGEAVIVVGADHRANESCQKWLSGPFFRPTCRLHHKGANSISWNALETLRSTQIHQPHVTQLPSTRLRSKIARAWNLLTLCIWWFHHVTFLPAVGFRQWPCYGCQRAFPWLLREEIHTSEHIPPGLRRVPQRASRIVCWSSFPVSNRGPYSVNAFQYKKR